MMDDDNDFIVYALRDINAGEQLFYSYDHSPGCCDDNNDDDDEEYWGTPEMLRDFGFVEGYPQTFYLSHDMAIVVDQVVIPNTEDDDGQNKQEYVVAKCLDDNCPKKAWIEEKVQNLIDLETSISEAEESNIIPERELAVIKDYHKALLVAFSAVWSQCPSEPPSVSISASAKRKNS